MNNKLRELKRLVEIAIALEESGRTVQDQDCKRFMPADHQEADMLLGDFVIYFNRAPKLCGYCGDLGHTSRACSLRLIHG